jgi:hypothetical protein
MGSEVDEDEDEDELQGMECERECWWSSERKKEGEKSV